MRIGGLPRVFVIAIALQLCGCAGLLGANRSGDSFREYREYMAERTAAELAESEDDDRDFDEVLTSARDFHRKRQSDQAMRLYFDAFRLDPEDVRAPEGIAYLQIASEPKLSEALLSKVIEQRPDSASAHAGLGLARFAQGDLLAAVTSLEHAVSLNPESSSAHNGLAVALGRLDRLPEGLRHAQLARELAPDDAQFANNLGIAHLRLGDLDAAEVSFDDAVALDPADPAFSNNLGVALGQQGRYEEAYSAFLVAGDEQVAQNNIGQMYQLRGELEEAIVRYELALLAGGESAPTVLRNLNTALDARDQR